VAAAKISGERSMERHSSILERRSIYVNYIHEEPEGTRHPQIRRESRESRKTLKDQEDGRSKAPGMMAKMDV
jgi:hypothetical protein